MLISFSKYWLNFLIIQKLFAKLSHFYRFLENHAYIRSFITFFAYNLSKMTSFPLRFWNMLKFAQYRAFQPNIWKNRSNPLIFWFWTSNHDYQQNLSGNELILGWFFSNPCVMTHRFVQFFQFFKKVSNCTQIQEQGQIQGKFDENYPWGCK